MAVFQSDIVEPQRLRKLAIRAPLVPMPNQPGYAEERCYEAVRSPSTLNQIEETVRIVIPRVECEEQIEIACVRLLGRTSQILPGKHEAGIWWNCGSRSCDLDDPLCLAASDIRSMPLSCLGHRRNRRQDQAGDVSIVSGTKLPGGSTSQRVFFADDLLDGARRGDFTLTELLDELPADRGCGQRAIRETASFIEYVLCDATPFASRNIARSCVGSQNIAKPIGYAAPRLLQPSEDGNSLRRIQVDQASILSGKLAVRPAEAAILISASRSTVYSMLARGELPSVTVGSSMRIPVAALQRWLEKNSQ